MKKEEVHALLFLVYALAWALVMVNFPTIFKFFGLI